MTAPVFAALRRPTVQRVAEGYPAVELVKRIDAVRKHIRDLVSVKGLAPGGCGEPLRTTALIFYRSEASCRRAHDTAPATGAQPRNCGWGQAASAKKNMRTRRLSRAYVSACVAAHTVSHCTAL
eukprot:888468-Pyramimonas_sp.AAC.1